MTPIFFDGWTGLFRVVIVGTCAYVALLLILRVSVNAPSPSWARSTSSSPSRSARPLSTVLLSEDVALAEGVTAMGLLVVLQFVVAWVIARSSRWGTIIKSEPPLVYRNGFLSGAMRTCRVSESELRQVARGEGHADLSAVQAMVLEPDGTISVLSGSVPELNPDTSP